MIDLRKLKDGKHNNKEEEKKWSRTTTKKLIMPSILLREGMCKLHDDD